jgi:molybdopterin-guanine dinucleotide biosynthesis protein A
MHGEWLPAVVTAGGKLDDALAAKAGTRTKAMVKFGGRTLLSRVVSSLRESGRVQKIIVVGPKAEIETEAKQAGADEVVQEGASGPQNVEIGLALLQAQSGVDSVLLAASDLPYLTAMAVRALCDTVKNDNTDIILPIATRADYEKLCPGKPNAFTKLADGQLTAGSLLFVRPTAIEKNRELVKKLFDARKNQFGMAQILGPLFVIKFLLGKLTVAEVEGKLGQLTGSTCKALRGADARLCVDFDNVQDYEYLVKSFNQG